MASRTHALDVTLIFVFTAEYKFSYLVYNNPTNPLNVHRQVL